MEYSNAASRRIVQVAPSAQIAGATFTTQDFAPAKLEGLEGYRGSGRVAKH
jgi:hypothetical protein